MSDSPELISAFSLYCDEMSGSKFILAESKISNILRTIAASTILFRLFDDVMADFDFAQEFNKCRVPNSFNRVSIRFPTDRRKNVALIFTLLVEFDAKRRDLYAFIKEFYCAETDVADGYAAFVKSAITQFKLNVLYLLDHEGENADIRSASDYFNLDDESSVVSEGDIKQQAIDLVSDIRELISTVSRDASLNLSEREDILILSEGLSTAIMSRNSKLIKITWIGLKNTLRLNKLYEEKAVLLASLVQGFLELLL